MQRAEPPQARLAFHVTVNPTAVPSHQLSLWSLWPHPKPHSHPAQVAGHDKLLLDLQGEFELEPTGGVKVAGRSFSIDRGTLISQGFGAGVRGRDGPSLWWSGFHEDHRGIFTLFLLGADEADHRAVHRILLFLPPIQCFPVAIPRSTATLTRRFPLPTHRSLIGAQDPIAELEQNFARMNTAQPQYRNSLLLVDRATDEVISILPLNSLGADLDSAPNSSPPKSSASASPSHNHTPSFDLAVTPNRARGLTLAEQVNEISSHMAGQPRSYAEYGDERSRTRARERDGEDDGIPDNGRRRRVPRDEVCEEAEEDEIEGYYLNRVLREVKGSKELYSNTGDDDEGMGENTLKKLQRGFQLLDDQMDSLEEYRSPPLVPDKRSRKHQHLKKEPPTAAAPLPVSPDSAPVAESVSSPSHFQHQPSPSTYTLATIDTGSRYATITEAYYQAQESRRASSATFSTEEADENDEPPSISQNDVKAPTSHLDIRSQSPQHNPSPSILSAAPSHALTPSNDNSNSVLLRFLGGESKITAQPIDEADIEREGLVQATVEASEVDSGGGWAWLGLLVGGWSSWLSGWWSVAPDPTTASAAEPRSRPRCANGEGGTGRLSVLYFDEDGLGRTAYIEGVRGGLSGRGLGGRW